MQADVKWFGMVSDEVLIALHGIVTDGLLTAFNKLGLPIKGCVINIRVLCRDECQIKNFSVIMLAFSKQMPGAVSAGIY